MARTAETMARAMQRAQRQGKPLGLCHVILLMQPTMIEALTTPKALEAIRLMGQLSPNAPKPNPEN